MILGIFTTVGIAKTIEARDNEGFDIFVEKFGVSTTAGAMDASRTTPNLELYRGAVSSRVAINNNTIKVICTVPQAQSLGLEDIREIYLYGKDSLNNDFMLALGQPQNPITYDPSGTVTMELQISLVNVDLTALYQFTDTGAVELAEHNTDPNAHMDYVKELRHAGVKVDAGPFNTDYEGALYDKRAEFDGTKATGTAGGVTFSSTYRGTECNGASLVFDGVKTTDQVMYEWNLANPDATVEHDDLTGAVVLPAQTLVLGGGTYNVFDKAMVYKDTDGLYKKAIANGTGASGKPFGLAYLGERTVKPLGLHKYNHSFVIGKNLYLSETVAGEISTLPTSTKVGYVHGINTIATNLGVPSEDFADEYDAIVTDIAGPKNFATTQQAISAMLTNRRILVAKLEELSSTLDCEGKRFDFFFMGKQAGWKRYAGTQEQHLIQFSAVPTSGTWRIVYSPVLTTVDMPYNADASAVQAAINAVFPSNLCTVTGDYSVGFTITHANLEDVPNPYFTDLGQNDIQKIEFSNIPDNGSFALDYNAETTPALAWNDDALLLESYLEALTGVSDVLVSGSFAVQQFTVEFSGVDGNKPQPQLVLSSLPANTLALGASPTTVTISTLQEGQYQANALVSGVTPVEIVANIVVEGTSIGDSKAIVVDAAGTTFTGLGLLKNFTDGIDLNGQTGCKIEMVFENVTTPIVHTGLTPEVDYNSRDSIGLADIKEIRVGQFGDYPDLISAYAAANTGDKILVTEDQVITTNLILDKDITVEFINGVKINVLSNITGNVLSLGTKLRTSNLKLFINHASSFTTAVYLFGQLGHHKDLGIETATGVTLTTLVNVDSACAYMFADGYFVKNSATITNEVVDNTSVKNNNYNFRSTNGVITPAAGGGLYGFDAVVGNSAQVAAGKATHTSTQAAHDYVPVGGTILILRGAPNSGVNITKNVFITGQGRGSELGYSTLQASASLCTIKNLRFVGGAYIYNGSVGHIIYGVFIPSGQSISDNNYIGVNSIEAMGE